MTFKACYTSTFSSAAYLSMCCRQKSASAPWSRLLSCPQQIDAVRQIGVFIRAGLITSQQSALPDLMCTHAHTDELWTGYAQKKHSNTHYSSSAGVYLCELWEVPTHGSDEVSFSFFLHFYLRSFSSDASAHADTHSHVPAFDWFPGQPSPSFNDAGWLRKSRTGTLGHFINQGDAAQWPLGSRDRCHMTATVLPSLLL